MKDLCIYHGNCLDGFAAAWVVWKIFGESNTEYFAGVYQQEPPSVEKRYVTIVDFSYRRPVLLKMAEQAESIRIIDHHKSAEADLRDFPARNVKVHFDMEHSGCILTWMHFCPDREPPQLLKHIEDRDLWKFALPCTREITAALASYEMNFKTWDMLMNPECLLGMHIEGLAIARKHNKDVENLVRSNMYWIEIGGVSVPVANLPATLTSDAGNLMATQFAPHSFAACFWNNKYGRTFSLRSVEGGADVSEVAEIYGGGGHKHAAGFSVGWDHPLARS